MALAPVTPIEPPALADLVAGRGLVHLERLPARTARYGELAKPAARPGLGAPGGRPAVGPPGRGHRPGPGRPVGGRWPRARPRASPSATRPPSPRPPSPRLRPSTALLHLPHQGPGPGPGPGLVRSRPARASSRPPTTATAPPRSAPGSGRNANVLLTNPEMLHSALLPHHAKWSTFLIRLRATWSSTSCTSCAASSAPTSPTCCVACAGCATSTAPTPPSCSARPPSAARGGWPPSCAACPSTEITDDGSPRGERLVAALEPRRRGRGGPGPHGP